MTDAEQAIVDRAYAMLKAVVDRVERWEPDDDSDAYHAMREIEQILGLPRKP